MHLRGRIAGRLWPWLAVWTLVGLGIRLATVYSHPNRPPGGDPFYYYYGARLLVAGFGFINPFDYYWHHHHQVASASFPPGMQVILTVPMIFGLKSYFATRFWCCILGAAGIVAVGLAGREIAGRRVGLLAALLAAVYPNLWMSDEIGSAETLDPLLIGVVLLLSYRFWKKPSIQRIIWLGAALGITMLARDELALLVVLIMVPLALLARSVPWKRRFAVAGIGLLSTAVVIAPWVGYNMARFEKPTYISNGLGVTLASADCNTTFSGTLEGYWSMACALKAPVVKGDESVQNAAYQNYVIKYLKHHTNRLVPVTLAKIGRAFGLYKPIQQINFDAMIETRPLHWAFVGLYMFYALAILSLGGTLVLLRRRIPVFPLWAVGLNVVIAVIIAFGNTRYRAPFEACLVIMSAVAMEWAWSRVLPERRRRGQAPPATPPPPSDEADPEPALSGTG